MTKKLVDIETYLQFAESIARQAGALMRDGFEKQVAVSTKSDGSPVTEVDKRINQLVINSIQRTYPDHTLLGEEADFISRDAHFKWVCDPLDGTKPFILGVPNSVFMLALMEDAETILSVVYDPFSDRMYHAILGQGAFCNKNPIHVNDQPLQGGYVVMGSDSYPFIAAIEKEGGRIEPVSGSGYKFMMIASGSAIATIKVKADFHDVTPGALIVQEAGGKVTALDGSSPIYDARLGGVIISNRTCHDDLVQIAQQVIQ